MTDCPAPYTHPASIANFVALTTAHRMTARARWVLLQILRPYLRNPYVDKGKWFLLEQLNPVPGIESEWASYGRRCVRTRYNFRITVDMVYAAHRMLYFTGEYEPDVSRLVARLLDSSWVFVDVGANIGFYTLMASKLAGSVISVEPGPETRALLEENLVLNGCKNVRVLPYALSDTTGPATLYQAGRDIGGASMRVLGNGAQEFNVETRRGDDILKEVTTSPVFIKIDVEGLEFHVLRGFAELLARQNVVVLVEITDTWLRSTGASAIDLFRWMRSRGFLAYLVAHARTRVRTRSKLVPLQAPAELFQYDALFARLPLPAYL